MCKSNTLELAKIKILVKKTGNNWDIQQTHLSYSYPN
jgi:hypothetical protein